MESLLIPGTGPILSLVVPNLRSFCIFIDLNHSVHDQVELELKEEEEEEERWPRS